MKRPPDPAREVFVDTSAFYAALSAADAQHEQAASALDSLLSMDALLVTTSFVVVETVSLLQSRVGSASARAFLLDMVPYLDVAWVEAGLYSRGVEAWLATGGRRLSLVDCVSFALMHEFRLETAFTLDRHFADQGFAVVP